MRWLALLAALLAVPAASQGGRIGEALAAKRFAGFALVARGDATLYISPAPGARRAWPWASVTKQIVAILVLREVERGRIDLDAPASRYLPDLGTGGAPAPTVRELLQHRAGLTNPDDSPADANGDPDFYTSGPTGLAVCLTGRKAPGGDWRYNNCDYVVLGALLERAAGTSVATLFARGIAGPLHLTSAAFVTPGARPPTPAVPLTDAERRTLARYGAAGGLIGRPADLLAIDRALLGDRLLTRASRDLLWAGDPKLGYMALGQWSFDAPLKGCAGPTRLIERRGEIGRLQVRNIIAPASGTIVILFIANGSYDFGEIWQGKGPSHDILAAALCP